jgi:Na+/melibiose symporter-like transporter
MRRRYQKIDPRKKIVVRALFYLNAILWLVYTIYIYFDMAVLNHNELSADIATMFAFVNAVVMFVSGIILGRQKKPIFYFALIVVVLNAVLTVLNLSDFVFVIAFILDIIILWLLLPMKNDYRLKS